LRILALLALTAALPLHAAERPEAFGYGASIRVEGDSAIYGVALPEAVYSGAARSDLGDLRVFNAAGEPVPFAFVPRSADEVARAGGRPLPLFPLRAPSGAGVEGLDVRVQRAADGTIVNIAARDGAAGARDRLAGYLIDATSFPEPLHALELALAGTDDLVARIRVEASDDLAVWRTLTADAPVVRLAADGQRLSATRVVLPAQRAKYLRLSWPAKGPGVELAGVQAEPAPTVIEPRRSWVGVPGVAANDRANAYDFDAGGRFPVERMRVVLPEPNTVAYVTVLARAKPDADWRPVRGAVVYRLLESGREIASPDLAVSVADARYWQLRVDPRSGALGSSAPRIELGWVPQEVAFAARGSAPFLLAWGNAEAQPASLPIETLVPGYRRDAGGKPGSGALVAIAPATLGEPQPIAGPAALQPRTDWKRIALWGSLVTAVTLLGWMAWRLARRVAPPAGPGGSAR
jgi:hypothetical protein